MRSFNDEIKKNSIKRWKLHKQFTAFSSPAQGRKHTRSEPAHAETHTFAEPITEPMGSGSGPDPAEIFSEPEKFTAKVKSGQNEETQEVMAKYSDKKKLYFSEKCREAAKKRG